MLLKMTKHVITPRLNDLFSTYTIGRYFRRTHVEKKIRRAAGRSRSQFWVGATVSKCAVRRITFVKITIPSELGNR